MASCVKRLMIRVPTKDTWLWNEDVQAIVILKREWYRSLLDVETLLLMQIIKWRRGKKKGCLIGTMF